MLSDTQLTEVVRQARCERCQGNGFRRVTKETERGEKISGEYDYLDCVHCHGEGIKIKLCRQLAAIQERDAS